jgi:hypothetical protein
MSVSTSTHTSDHHSATFPAYRRTLTLDIAAALNASSAYNLDPSASRAPSRKGAAAEAPAPPPPSPVEWDATTSDDERLALAAGRKT